MARIDRRRLFGRTVLGAGAVLLGGAGTPRSRDFFTRLLDHAAGLNEAVQHFVTPPGAEGRHYTKADISTDFKANGTTNPDTPEYNALVANGFADWRLTLDGLVDHPMQLSLAELRAMNSVTQITRHDCVEGWSCIGEWTGVPLATVLRPLGVQKKARYVMFFCYDTVPGAHEKYYESIDLAEAHHPETILAYAMNGKALPIPHGAPLRLRLGRQLGYKMPKYLKRIELVERFDRVEGGHGGFYEDVGYAWYAGI